jgi:hypothetical protein
MTAFQTVLVDEILWGETDGFRIVDHSKPVDDPDRVFWLKTILLFWVGDYPGLGKLANMKHAGFYGCHWCKGFFYSHLAGHNVCIHNRRNLRHHHPYRTDTRWTHREPRDPVPLRTKEEVEAQGREVHAMEGGAAKKRRQQATGVNGICLLVLISLFDIVWDMMPDMMHIVKGMCHTLYLVYGALYCICCLRS